MRGPRRRAVGWWLGLVGLALPVRAGREAPLSPYEPLCRRVKPYAAVAAEAAPVHLAPAVRSVPAVQALAARHDAGDLAPPLRDAQTVPLLLARLHAGDPDPSLPRRLRALGAERLCELLHGLSWRSAGDRAMMGGLAGALLELEAVPVDGAGELSYGLALNLAVGLAQRGDDRSVAICEGLLARRDAKTPGLVPELIVLAGCYAARGDWLVAARTWLRLDDYSTHVPELANARIEAARLYQRLGEADTAARLYDEVPSFGYGWASGVAATDLADLLMRQGAQAAARQVLARPISGTFAEQAMVMVTCRLGLSYLQSGELDQAEGRFKDAVLRYEALDQPLQGEGLERYLGRARWGLQLIEQFRNRPVAVSPDEVRLAAGGSASVIVTALRPCALTADAGQPALYGEWVADWARPPEELFLLRRELRLTVDGPVATPVTTTLRLTVGGQDEPVATVRVRVETGPAGEEAGRG